MDAFMKSLFALLAMFTSLSAFAGSPITCTDNDAQQYSMSSDESGLHFNSNSADFPMGTAIYPSHLHVKVAQRKPIPAGLIVFSDDSAANPLSGESTSSFSGNLLELVITRTGDRTFSATPIIVDNRQTVILKYSLSCTEHY